MVTEELFARWLVRGASPAEQLGRRGAAPRARCVRAGAAGGAGRLPGRARLPRAAPGHPGCAPLLPLPSRCSRDGFHGFESHFLPLRVLDELLECSRLSLYILIYIALGCRD